MSSVSLLTISEFLGSFAPADRGVATLILLTLAIASAVIFTLRFKSIRTWLDTRIRVALGTVGAVLAVVVIFGSILLMWGQADRFSELLTTSISPDAVIRMMITIIVIIVAYGSTKFIHHSIEHIADDHTTLDRHSQQLFTRFVQVTVLITTFLTVLSVWDVDLANFLIGAGALGVIIGYAGRKTLSAGIAGFIIMISQPFKIGDWIEVGDKRGRVMEITVVNTRLQSHTGEYVIIPNDVIADREVTNLSDRGKLQLHVDVGIDYDDDIDTATDVIEQAIRDVKTVMGTPSPSVHPHDFGTSQITLRVHYWIDNPSETRRRRARADVITTIKDALDDENIQIPFPQRTTSFRNSDELPGADSEYPNTPRDADTDR